MYKVQIIKNDGFIAAEDLWRKIASSFTDSVVCQTRKINLKIDVELFVLYIAIRGSLKTKPSSNISETKTYSMFQFNKENSVYLLIFCLL